MFLMETRTNLPCINSFIRSKSIFIPGSFRPVRFVLARTVPAEKSTRVATYSYIYILFRNVLVFLKCAYLGRGKKLVRRQNNSRKDRVSAKKDFISIIFYQFKNVSIKNSSKNELTK